MAPDGAPRPAGTGAGRGPRPLPAALGAAFGALALLLALLALRGRRAERRPGSTGGPARAGDRAGVAGAPAGPGEEVLEFFGELRAGSALDRWVILAIGAPRGGAIPVRMAGADGRPFDVEVLRRDPEGPRAPAEEGEIAVYLPGVAAGSATPEEQGLGAMTLAAALADAGRPPPSWLRPIRRRPD